MSTLDRPTLTMRNKLLATLALALLAVAGNYLSLTLFFGVHFIFGSIAVMVAVLLLGTVPAVLVAIAGGAYTLLLWGHPYALLIFSIEALVVGLLYQRGLRNLVLADLLYWMLIGIPLVLLFYRGVLGMGWEPTNLIALKQAINALFNTLVAGVLVIAWQLSVAGRLALPSKPSLAVLLFHSLLTVTLLAGVTPILYESHKQRDEQEAFMLERLHERAGQLLARIEADHQLGRQRYDYHLGRVQSRENLGLAILSPESGIIASRGELHSLSGEGQIQALANGLSIWLPAGQMSAMQRWQRGVYTFSLALDAGPQMAAVLVELPAAEIVATLERERLNLFAMLAGIFALGVLITAWLSLSLSRPLRQLETISDGMAAQIAEGIRPEPPQSGVKEYASLGQTLYEMSSTLASSFHELREARTELASQVEVRTAALRQTTRELHNVLAAASEIAIIATDRSGQITLFNSGAQKMLGYSADALVGRQTPALLHLPEEIAARSAELSKTLARPVEGFESFVAIADRDGLDTREWTYVHKDGHHLPVLLTVTPQRDETGAITGYLSVAEDISERKAAEQELRESEQRLRNMLENSPIASRIARSGGHEVIFSNRRYAELLNVAVNEINGTDPSAYYAHQDDYKDILLRLERGEQIFDKLIELTIPGVGTKWTLASYLPTQFQGSAAVLGWFYDITDRKQAETALAEQAQHTQAILDNMVDGIITIDTKGIIQSFSPAATRIFAYTAEEVLGKNVSILMPNPHREAHDSYLRNYQATGVARIIGIGREVEGQRKDGSLFPMDLAISEITQHGQPLYVGMVRDITERKRVERMKSEFVSTVSHELRTPLTSISGALGLVVGGAIGELPEQIRQMIGIAYKNSQRLTHLINDLLDMEKIAAGKLHFEMQRQPLLPLLEQALEANQPFAQEHHVLLMFEGGRTEIPVWVDAQRLMQVLANLLSNAIKFSPAGETVLLSLQASNRIVRITVRDKGPGIPQEFRSRIFQKFSQADASDTRAKGGTGLGLAITRELVERMGGAIGFDSVEGEGASFWIELPILSREPIPEQVLPDMLSTPRVLVVEDDPDVAGILCMLLERAGYRVDLAETGEQALQALQQGQFAAITLDLMLPDINGLEIVRRLRQRAETLHLPIIVVSAKMEEGRLAINGDFSDIEWLAKPIDDRHLLSVVERVIEDAQLATPRVLHVEDDEDLHQVVRSMLGGRFEFELATTLEEAIALITLERFDLVILDIGLPDGSGWALLSEIRARQPQARIIILSGVEVSPEQARQVEQVLLKSQVSAQQLLDALNNRIGTSWKKELDND